MLARKCAYCGSEHNLTREHLWPKSLHKRLKDANGGPDGLFWLRRLDKEVAGEPTIRDVCALCNNGVLSELDAYICAMFDAYFVRILQRNERIKFEFDYHLLKRWLLKMSFNSARIHSSFDLFAYSPLLPYIMGQSTNIGRSVQLYLQLQYPAPIPPEHMKNPEWQEAPVLWEPRENRVGHIVFSVPGQGRKVLRAVHLRSYSFLLAFFSPDERAATHQDFANVFQSMMPGAVLLLASRQRANLICNGIDAWDSFNGARENAIQSESSNK